MAETPDILLLYQAAHEENRIRPAFAEEFDDVDLRSRRMRTNRSPRSTTQRSRSRSD